MEKNHNHQDEAKQSDREKLAEFNHQIQNIDQRLSEVQERISVGVKEAHADYEQLCVEFTNLNQTLQNYRQNTHSQDLEFYLMFLEINTYFIGVKNKIEITHYLIMLFQNILK